MGNKSSKLFKNSTQPTPKAQEDKTDFQDQKNDDSPQQLQTENSTDQNSTNQNLTDQNLTDQNSTDQDFSSPFVYYRRGSMYIDEDGDSAHEFYVEVTDGSKATLKQINNKNLTPQGDVLLEVPCLRNDYPVILLDQNSRIKD